MAAQEGGWREGAAQEEGGQGRGQRGRGTHQTSGKGKEVRVRVQIPTHIMGVRLVVAKCGQEGWLVENLLYQGRLW